MRKCPIQWTAEGRKHYQQDLEPYVCLSEACYMARPSFAFSDEWFSHMKSNHSEAWSSKIHSRPLWTCNAMTEEGDLVHENDTVYAFSTKTELMIHFKRHHPQLLPKPNQSNDSNNEGDISQPGMQHHWSRSARAVSSCPLCSFREELKNEPDDETIITSKTMGSHIADHLHHLMMVTLQIMKAMEPMSKDAPDLASGPSSDLSEPCSELEDDEIRDRRDDRLERLLLELRETYQVQLTVLKSLYPRWTDKDLLWVIDDAKGDLEASKQRLSITEADRNEAENANQSGGQALSIHNLYMFELDDGNDQSLPQSPRDRTVSEEGDNSEKDRDRDLVFKFKETTLANTYLNHE
ncbi:hypothetical protein BU24DRAFT_459937 [Aaosphaeria arxii CBS 175.79]|uniref:C2H2-type domain-containing protein n=1 Tax=Aaosphaeria arxii CBS 175.79 TaxID=1450172 RepID=A0A6A5XVR9_9PLEO|nr:uncharacterized protein BU24DRAFT_459937 [Aaosphaeria arxii CBS 175.79]KAF2016811.1 hypothetical protein BU24DRAFT_459937 [Aaosphaeria arxii CBS 175.79]